MKRMRWVPMLGMAAMVTLGGAVAGCGQTQGIYPDKEEGDTAPRMSNEKHETIFGDGGLFGGSSKGKDEQPVGIGVNSFLWRATLDTVAFMPLASADPFGGVILTDWYQMPETPNERFKLNIFIVDRMLRADGVKVSVFKQVRDGSGHWTDAQVDPRMGPDLENAILTRARQLRIVSQ